MATSTALNLDTLGADAKNRAWRTALQALILNVIIDVSRAVADKTQGNYDAGDLWLLVGRVAGLSAVSFIWRKYLDRSTVPSAVPPTDVTTSGAG